MKSDTYYILSSLLAMAASCQLAVSQDSGQNYVLVRTMTSESGSTFQETVQYYDGLGRASLTAALGATPSGANLLSLTEYDAAGRKSYDWLPFPSSSEWLPCQSARSAAQSYYGGVQERPHVHHAYEPSPLGRPTVQSGPGQAWTGHPDSRASYGSNSSSGALSCRHYAVGPDGTLSDSGPYAAGELAVTRVEDADGRVSYVFADRLGRRLLERRSDGAGGFADTYYVYDDLGRLRYVLPPGCTDLSAATLGRYAYQYRYDGRGRCVWKKLPGCDAVEQVYDRGGRLAFRRDGVQRESGEWTFYRYDALGRPIAEGTCRNAEAPDMSERQATCRLYVPLDEADLRGALLLGSVGIPKGELAEGRVERVWFYDTYDFLDYAEFSDRTLFPQAGHGAYGLATGGLELSEDGVVLASAAYYDGLGRAVRECGTNHLGGYDVVETSYTFTGQPSLSTHRSVDGRLRRSAEGYLLQNLPMEDMSVSYFYDYDHAGRLVRTRCLPGNLPASFVKTLVEQGYDELGRLSWKRFHGSDSLRVDYSYNLRGWLTGIESGYFCQQLEYAEGPSPEYGGNVSRVRWQTSPGSPGTGYGYSYAYDGLNRLVLAQSLDSRGSSTVIAHNHSAWYGYDAMGNVTSVVRNGLLRPAFNFGRVDELSLEYDGNRLLKVTDTSSGTPLYHNAFHYVDGSDASVEFAYDSNGNLTADLDKGVELSYNRLNLPVEAVCGEGAFACRYNRDGVKLVERFGYGLSSSDGMLMPVPVGLSAQPLSVSGEYRFDEAAYSGDIVRLRSGTGRVGDRTDNLTGEELQVRHADGYVSFTGQLPTYHYFIRDYQGNVVAVVSPEGGVEQRTHYYPYGGWYGESTEPLLQERKYGGKELELTAGVNWYDFGARLQRPDLCRFQTMDPLAEKYYGVSPYAYCGGNPVMYIDPSGEAWRKTVMAMQDGSISPTGYEWVPDEEARDAQGNLLPGYYSMAIFFSENGTFVEGGKYNMGSSTATVYGLNGPDDIETYRACTRPSDSKKYVTIPEREYAAVVGKHHNTYDALRMSDVDKVGTRVISLDFPNPSSDKLSYEAKYINIHTTLGNATGYDSKGNAWSEGCLLIDSGQWQDFMRPFKDKGSDFVISVTVSRHFSWPTNVNMEMPNKPVPLGNLIHTTSFGAIR